MPPRFPGRFSGEWREDFTGRLDPKKPLDSFVAEYAKPLQTGTVDILDVGAGPLTSIGYALDGVKVNIVAVDPLSSIYQRLYEKFEIEPPVRTMFAPAEDVSSFFPDQRFDIVHCRNALDHSFDPLRGLGEMLKLARPGGVVLLDHHRNEAEREGYAGFHQSNFDVIDGEFVIWDRSTRFVVSAEYSGQATFNAWLEGEGVRLEARKTVGREDLDPANEARARLADVWRASTDAMIGMVVERDFPDL